jgi:hypothetical protein
MSFMLRIDNTRLSPLDQLAFDYSLLSSPSIDFCCRSLGVPEPDEVVARRLNVKVATVKNWREIGKRANGGYRR